MKNYRCPCCKSSLIKGIDKKYETLADHISCQETSPSRNTWVCSNNDCELNTNRHGSFFWDGDGAFYGYRSLHTQKNNTTAALGSFEAKMEVEIYKKDENYSYKWRGFQVEVFFEYQSNEEKEILSRKKMYRVILNGIWGSSSPFLLVAIIKTIHSKIFRFGSKCWKTPEERKEGIKQNWKNFQENIKLSWLTK